MPWRSHPIQPHMHEPHEAGAQDRPRGRSCAAVAMWRSSRACEGDASGPSARRIVQSGTRTASSRAPRRGGVPEPLSRLAHRHHAHGVPGADYTFEGFAARISSMTMRRADRHVAKKRVAPASPPRRPHVGLARAALAEVRLAAVPGPRSSDRRGARRLHRDRRRPLGRDPPRHGPCAQRPGVRQRPRSRIPVYASLRLAQLHPAAGRRTCSRAPDCSSN